MTSVERETMSNGKHAQSEGGEESLTSVRKVVGRAALVILTATVVGRLLGLARETITAYLFGANAATDAYFLAYKVPYLLVMMVSGALTATFVPVFSYRLAIGRREEAWDLGVNVGNLVMLVLVAVTAILLVLAPWIIPLVGFGFSAGTAKQATQLFRILMAGFVFDAMSGLLIAMLNSLRRFVLAAYAPAIGTVATLIVVVLLYRPLGVKALAIGSVIGSVVGALVLLPGLRDQQIRYRPYVNPRDPAVREVAGMIWPVLLGSAVGKISIFSDQVLGSMLSEGSISSLSYADKLFQLPLGLFVAGIAVPIFPLLSEQVAAGGHDKVKAIISFALRLMGFVLLPVMVGMIVLRTPLIGLLFQYGKFSSQDTERTAWAFLFLALGLYMYAGRDTLTRVFYAYHDTRTPVKISAATVALNVGVSYVLMQVMGVGGLSLGTTVALTVNFVVLAWLLRRKIGPLGLGLALRSLLKVCCASAIMGLAVFFLDLTLSRLLPAHGAGDAIRVVVGGLVGAAIYVLSSHLMKVPELADTFSVLRAALSRGSSK